MARAADPASVELGPEGLRGIVERAYVIGEFDGEVGTGADLHFGNAVELLLRLAADGIRKLLLRQPLRLLIMLRPLRLKRFLSRRWLLPLKRVAGPEPWI